MGSSIKEGVADREKRSGAPFLAGSLNLLSVLERVNKLVNMGKPGFT